MPRHCPSKRALSGNHFRASNGSLSTSVGIKQALKLGAIGFDAVKHLVLCQVEKRPPRLDLDVYPYLPRAKVETTSAASYLALMTEAAQ